MIRFCTIARARVGFSPSAAVGGPVLAMVLELATVLVKWSGMAASPVVPAAAAASGKCTGRHCSTFDVNCRFFFHRAAQKIP